MSADAVIGQILDGKYSIEKQLGKGGMGTVYLSTHIGTGRPVALKVVAPDFMKRSEFVERFRREAKAAGRLRHPNVVDVTDFGFAKDEQGRDIAYLVMEYLDGCTLGEVLEEEKKLPISFTIDILEQVSSAVEEAHKQGIIHRDLKPDNIWLEPNLRGGYTVKVLDFGIAKLEEAQIADAAESLEIPYAGAARTKFNHNKDTFADGDGETIADKKNSTIISENETMALVEESKTLALENAEAGTMIQQNGSNSDISSEAGTQIIQPVESKKSLVEETDSEGGTAILPADGTQAIIAEDGKGTKLMTADGGTSEVVSESYSNTNLTRVGAVLGTPLYMSPEQCRGEKLTPRSDIYSLAVIAYQMLSGELPFTGDYVKVMNGHKTQEPPPLKAKKVPKKLKQTIMQSLSKNIYERPATAEAFASKVRANFEGIGNLLRHTLVIYSQNLPKFLQVTALVFSPVALILFSQAVFEILVGFEFIERTAVVSWAMTMLNISYFVGSSICAAFLGGMMTWIVAQYLSYPLRPISLRPAFRELRKRAKSLSFTVIVSSLFTYISLAFCFFPFFYFLAKFMLISPSIMMEGITGKAAIKRSMELTKRSFRTVFAAACLTFFLSVGLGGVIGGFVGLANTSYQSIVRLGDLKDKVEAMKKEGVKPQTEEEIKKSAEAKIKKNGDAKIIIQNKQINVNVDDKSVNNDSEEDKKLEKKFKKFGVITSTITQLLMFLLLIFLGSFSSVLTALLYFKTRLAGGESMQDLLGKLDNTDETQSIWQKRVRERLIQSGKITETSHDH